MFTAVVRLNFGMEHARYHACTRCDKKVNYVQALLPFNVISSAIFWSHCQTTRKHQTTL